MTLANGRPYLAIPGPSTMPDRVLAAMHRAAPNIYAGALPDMVETLWPDLRMVAGTTGHVAMYIGIGHAGWEAANANLFSRGDKALVLAVGQFGLSWANSARAMGIEVEVLDFGKSQPADMDRVEAALARYLGDRLGLELRSGNIVMGSARIEEQARSGRIAVLLHASDSSADGRRKLDQAWRVGTDAEGSGWRGQTLPLDRTALSVALGRDNVVHLGVAGHPGDMRAATRVLQAVSRLVQYVGDDRASATNETGRDTSGHADQPQGGTANIDEYVKD